MTDMVAVGPRRRMTNGPRLWAKCGDQPRCIVYFTRIHALWNFVLCPWKRWSSQNNNIQEIPVQSLPPDDPDISQDNQVTQHWDDRRFRVADIKDDQHFLWALAVYDMMCRHRTTRSGILKTDSRKHLWTSLYERNIFHDLFNQYIHWFVTREQRCCALPIYSRKKNQWRR
jgi:hypothetical protein